MNDNKILKENNRIYSLELLRIVSMGMILVLHFFAYTSVREFCNPFSANYFFSVILNSVCGVSVNCYVLISGYFCLKSKFNFHKLLLLFSEVWFYSVSIYLVLLLTNNLEFSLKDTFFNFFPVLTRQYWFITTYIGVYILSPIIKNISKKLEKSEHLTLLLIGFILFVVYYNFFFFCDNLNFGGATGIVWFVYLYFWGTFLSKYYKLDYNWKKHLKRYLIVALMAIVSFIPFWMIYLITKKSIFLEGASVFDSVYNSIFVFISSIFFFILFLNIEFKPKNILKKIIDNLATSSFAVYLIHENRYIRNILWNIYPDANYESIFNILIYCLIIIILIYSICCFVDKIRIFIFKYTLNSSLVKRKFLYFQFRLEKIWEENIK